MPEFSTSRWYEKWELDNTVRYGGKLTRNIHHWPSTIDVQNRIDHLPLFPFEWTARCVAWKEFRNLLPFGILEIGR